MRIIKFAKTIILGFLTVFIGFCIALVILLGSAMICHFIPYCK